MSFLFVYSTFYGQSVANYSVTRTTSVTYNSIISTGNSFAGWRYTGTFSEDDNRSEATDIGFDFWYNGQRFTQFSVSTNGFIDFSGSTDDGGPQADDYGYFNGAFSSSTIANGTWLALAPFYDDMTTRAGSDPLGTSIKYQLSGTAPNRILTVEWDGMAVYNNTTPDLNFQVRLYESTGVIEYNYETMNSGTNTFSYTLGINSDFISNPPTTAQLKTQQSANSTTFNNTPQNNLSIMPAANSQIRFTPPSPTPASGSLFINGITNTGMTLNWPNWASNEVGYVLYFSTDNINFYFNSQTALNATSSVVSGLLPSTIYYWRIYAVTEGGLSLPLSGSATTLAPGTITSVTSGRWDVAGTWDCACIPSAGDNVLIRNNHTVTLRSNNMQCNNLTVGEGTNGTLRFTTNTARTLTINGNLTIRNGAILTQASNSNTVHTINFRGNITNDGTLDLLVDGDSRCNAVFIKTNGNQIVNGAGTATDFYTISVDKNLKSNQLEITTTNFSCDPDALIFASGGTFKFSSSGTNTFQLFNTTRDVPITGKIWMNSPNSTMNFGAGINLIGDLQLEAGTMVVGNAADENLTSRGGQLEINNGNLRIAGRYAPNDPESISRYKQTGGTLTLPTVLSTSTTQAPFSMNVTGSSKVITGGTILIQREGGSGAQNLGYNTSGVTTSLVTGGILQIGDAATPAGQTMLINAAAPVGSLLINSANATAQLSVNNLSVVNDITLSAGGLIDAGRNITLGGNWLATSGTFTTSTTSTVLFNGVNQSITTAGHVFNNLSLSGSGSKSLQDNLSVNGNLLIAALVVPVNSGFNCTLSGNWINNGSFSRNNETILLNGTSNQSIGGTSVTDFTNITVNKSAGSVSVDGTVNLHNTLSVLSATTFDADGAGGGVFTLLSTGDDPAIDARIASLPAAATIAGNVTVQRFIAPENPGSTRVYRYISSPVSGQFVSDWQDDFPITGTFSNPSTEFPLGSGNTSICGRALIPSSPSLFRYVETVAGTGALDLGWIAYPGGGLTSAAPLQVGLGYAAFIRECTNPTVMDVRGPVNQGNVALTSLVSLTTNGDVEDGFNLVGNPYPSAIDWNTDAGWTRTGISSVIYIRDNGAGGGFTTYDYTDNTPLVIAMGQAFWVRVTGAHSFSVNEQAKTNSAAVFYRARTLDKLSVVLTKGDVTDRAIIKVNPQSSHALDDFDGPKLDNSLFDISTLSGDGLSMAVNSLDKIDCGEVIPIKIKDMTSGTYHLSFERLGEFNEYDIKLFDRFTNAIINVSDESSYTFSVSSVASKASNRFELRFAGIEVDQNLTLSTSATICEHEDAVVIVQASQPGIDYYVTLDNIIVSDSIVGSGSSIMLTVPHESLALGANRMVIKASRACGDVFELNQQPEVFVNSPSEPQIMSRPPKCKEGSVTLSAKKIQNGVINWYDQQDATTPLFVGEVFDTPILMKSKTYYAAVVASGGCEGDRIAVEAVITPYDEVTIFMKGDTLISSYSNGNQWYKDGEILPGAVNKKIVANISGTYQTVVQVSESCTTSASRAVVINRPSVITGHEEPVTGGIVIFPNPVIEELNIIADKVFDDKAFIIDVHGKVLATVALDERINNKEGSYNLDSFPDGIYFVRGVRSGKPVIVKIVKQ